MIKETDLENIKYKTVYDYYDQPISFTFELYSKLYYANLIDYEEGTNTDIYWVNEVEEVTIRQSEEGNLTIYDLMTGLEEDEFVYIIASSDLSGSSLITRLTQQQALDKYATNLPDRDTHLEV